MTPEPVCRQSVSVNLENGLHLVPGSRIAVLSRQFECDVKIYHGTTIADAKNVFDIMALGAVAGTQLELETRGADAEAAIKALVHLFETDFEIDDAQPQPGESA